jgi:hypothetical protein
VGRKRSGQKVLANDETIVIRGMCFWDCCDTNADGTNLIRCKKAMCESGLDESRAVKCRAQNSRCGWKSHATLDSSQVIAEKKNVKIDRVK